MRCLLCVVGGPNIRTVTVLTLLPEVFTYAEFSCIINFGLSACVRVMFYWGRGFHTCAALCHVLHFSSGGKDTGQGDQGILASVPVPRRGFPGLSWGLVSS